MSARVPPDAGRRVCEAVEWMKQDVLGPKALGNPPEPLKRAKSPAPERHRWLDQWLVAKGEPLRQLVAWVVVAVERIEKHERKRQRARRPDDQAKHVASIDALVSNLAYAVLMPPGTGRLAVRLGNLTSGMTRYDNPALGTKPLRKLIRLLEGADFLSLNWSLRRREVSSIAPSAWFVGKVREHAVSLADFGRHPNEEVILLTRNTRPSAESAEQGTHRERIDYSETPATQAYRTELRRLNDFLARADIRFVDDRLEPRVDAFDRALTRRFTILPQQPERFDQNGRLFGGFWMNLKSARRANIRINGEPVATLDYSSMFTRLAYARLRAVPPAGDLYALEGAEDHRSGIKMAMNIFLFDTSSRRTKWPTEMGVGVGTDTQATPASPPALFDARLPEGWTVGRTKKAILKRHPTLKDAWGKGLGYQLMFDESRILLRALNALMAENIPALGLHDGLLVQASKVAVTKRIMEQAAHQVAGVEIPVAEKG